MDLYSKREGGESKRPRPSSSLTYSELKDLLGQGGYEAIRIKFCQSQYHGQRLFSEWTRKRDRKVLKERGESADLHCLYEDVDLFDVTI